MRGHVLRAAATIMVVGLLSGAFTSGPANAAGGMKMSGWLPYWLSNTSTSSALTNSDLLEDVSPFWFDAQSDSEKVSTVGIVSNGLSWGTRPEILARLHEKGMKVLPSITDGTPPRQMAGVLASPTKRTALVGQITNLVNNNDYDGIDLDFEKFAFNDGQSSWATTKPAWVAFISELSTSLHATGKLLAVSVPPMYGDRSGYWVYAFREIAPAIDKLRIMAYDYSWDRPGPIGGPLSWVRSVLTYAVAAVPASKVWLGTPTYGRDWVTSGSGSGCPESYPTRALNTSGVTFTDEWARNAPSMERTRTYTEAYNPTCTVQRSAWVPDAQTTLARWNVAQEFGIAGLAQWMIGTEQAGQWDLLRGSAIPNPDPTIPNPDPTIPTPDPTIPPVVVVPPAPPAATDPARVPVATGEIWVTTKSRNSVTLSGKLPSRGKKSVSIFQLVKGEFEKVGEVTTNAKGRFSIVISARGKVRTFRAKSKLGVTPVLVVRR